MNISSRVKNPCELKRNPNEYFAKCSIIGFNPIYSATPDDPFRPKFFIDLVSNRKIQQSSYQKIHNRFKIGSKSYDLKKWSLIENDATKCWFFYSWIVKIQQIYDTGNFFLGLKMYEHIKSNTYMGYGSCTAMIVACSIPIITISIKLIKYQHIKRINKNKASLKRLSQALWENFLRVISRRLILWKWL